MKNRIWFYANYWELGGVACCCCCGGTCCDGGPPLGDESFADLWLFFGAGGGLVDKIIARIRRCADCKLSNKQSENRHFSHLKCYWSYIFTCTLKNGPIIWTVVSSSAGAVPCSGSLIMLPVTRCNSRTFWPPLPMIRPTCPNKF